VAPFWFTPHAAGPREYGFHWLITLVANCYLLAGLAFLGYMALTQLRRPPVRVGGADGAMRTGGDNVMSKVGAEERRGLGQGLFHLRVGPGQNAMAVGISRTWPVTSGASAESRNAT